MKRLGKLDERHKAACRLRIEGKNNAYIASELAVTKKTLAVWFSDDIVKDYLKQIAENVEQEFAVTLASAGMQAVHELTRMLGKDDTDATMTAGQKLAVAESLMDRLPGTARIVDRPVEGASSEGGDTNILQVFANMNDKDLSGFLQGGWRELEAGDGASNKTG